MVTGGQGDRVLRLLLSVGMANYTLSRRVPNMEPHVVRGIPVRFLYVATPGFCFVENQKNRCLERKAGQFICTPGNCRDIVHSPDVLLFYFVSQVSRTIEPCRRLVRFCIFPDLAVIWYFPWRKRAFLEKL